MADTTEARRLADELKARFGATVPTRQAAAMLRALADERDELRAQVEALRADAERYRWLRLRKVVTAPHEAIARHAAERFDAAIDAARSQEMHAAVSAHDRRDGRELMEGSNG